MGKRNQQTTTQQTTSEPWKPSQPYLRDTMHEAQRIYDSGQGQQYYPGDTYVGMGDTTNQALSQIEGLAGQGTPGVDAANQYNTDVLSGRYLGEGNPYLQTIWGNQADELTNRLKDVYSGMGRYGSAPMEGELTRNLGALHAQLFGGAYENERNRMGSAASLAPTLDAARYQGADRLFNAGLYRDLDTQNERDADVARWNFNQQAPMNALDWYSQIVNGTAGLGGTTNSTTTEPGPTFLQKLLGGVSTGAGIMGSLGTAGWGFPMLTAMGLMSDERMKQDIHRIGTTDGGLPIYSFRYRNAGPTVHIGVMAQEAARSQPEAVKELNGVLYVDYSRVR